MKNDVRRKNTASVSSSSRETPSRPRADATVLMRAPAWRVARRLPSPSSARIIAVAEEPEIAADQRLGADPARRPDESAAPSASERAASIPCVSGSPCAIVDIQPGSVVEPDVHAAEDEQQPEDDVVQRRRLADEQAERRDRPARARCTRRP